MSFEHPLRLQYTLAAVGVIGSVASLGYSVYKDVKSEKQDKQAAAEGASLKRPFEKIQDEYYQNQNIAKEQATSGLPIDVKLGLQKQRDRGLSSSLDALKQGGGGPNDFGRLNSIYDDSLKNESAEDAQQHFANIQYLLGVNKDIAGQKTTQWGVNEYQPYESKLAEIQGRRTAAQTNEANAVNQGIGSITSITTSLKNAVGGYKNTPSSVDASHDGDSSWYGSDALPAVADTSNNSVVDNTDPGAED